MLFLSMPVPVIIILFSGLPNIRLAFCLPLVDGLTSPLAPLKPVRLNKTMVEFV